MSACLLWLSFAILSTTGRLALGTEDHIRNAIDHVLSKINHASYILLATETYIISLF